MTGRDEQAFRTIGEVAESLDLPAHVLRFWETRFKELEPIKRAGGRRYYRPRDVELVIAIRHLLYGQGYTIKGVQRILKEQGARAVIESVRSGRFPAGAEPATPERREPASPQEPMEPPVFEAPEQEAAESASSEEPPREELSVEELSVEELSVEDCAVKEPPLEPEPSKPALPEPQSKAPGTAHLPATTGQLHYDAPRLGEKEIGELRLALADLSECRRLLLLTKG